MAATQDTDATGQEPDPLDAVEAEYPGWVCFNAVVPGLVYARRPNSSPPMIVRANTPDGLGPKIEAEERKRGLR